MDITRRDNIETKLIMFFATKDGEAPFKYQKQDLVLTAAQIMNFF